MDMAANLQQPSQQQQGVGFTLKLPELQLGRHEVSLTQTLALQHELHVCLYQSCNCLPADGSAAIYT